MEHSPSLRKYFNLPSTQLGSTRRLVGDSGTLRRSRRGRSKPCRWRKSRKKGGGNPCQNIRDVNRCSVGLLAVPGWIGWTQKPLFPLNWHILEAILTPLLILLGNPMNYAAWLMEWHCKQRCIENGPNFHVPPNQGGDQPCTDSGLVQHRPIGFYATLPSGWVWEGRNSEGDVFKNTHRKEESSPRKEVWVEMITVKIKSAVKNIRMVAQWWTSSEGNLLRC